MLLKLTAKHVNNNGQILCLGVHAVQAGAGGIEVVG